MKYALRYVFCLLLLLIVLTTACSAAQICPLTGSDLAVAIPSDYIVFTPGFDLSDPDYAINGQPAESIAAFMEEYPIALCAINPETEICFFAEIPEDTELNSLADLNSKERRDFLNNILTFFEGPDFELLSWEYCKSSIPCYKILHRSLSDVPPKGPLTYYTYTLSFVGVHQGKQFVFYFISDPYDFSQEELEEAEAIALSVAPLSAYTERENEHISGRLVLAIYLISLLISVALGIGPILFYRFHKCSGARCMPGKAIKIVVVWAVVYAVLLFLLDDWLPITLGALPTGAINYFILTGSRRKRILEPAPPSDDPSA